MEHGGRRIWPGTLVVVQIAFAGLTVVSVAATFSRSWLSWILPVVALLVVAFTSARLAVVTNHAAAKEPVQIASRGSWTIATAIWVAMVVVCVLLPGMFGHPALAAVGGVLGGAAFVGITTAHRTTSGTGRNLSHRRAPRAALGLVHASLVFFVITGLTLGFLFVPSLIEPGGGANIGGGIAVLFVGLPCAVAGLVCLALGISRRAVLA